MTARNKLAVTKLAGYIAYAEDHGWVIHQREAGIVHLMKDGRYATAIQSGPEYYTTWGDSERIRVAWMKWRERG